MLAVAVLMWAVTVTMWAVIVIVCAVVAAWALKVMSDAPFRYKMGEAFPGQNYPTCICANNTHIGMSTPAVIVQANKCVMHENVDADVSLMPTSHDGLERV